MSVSVQEVSGVDIELPKVMNRVWLEIRVSFDLCTGCGLCQRACPEIFEIASGSASVKSVRSPRECEERCFDAMEDCPGQAIVIQECQGSLLGVFEGS